MMVNLQKTLSYLEGQLPKFGDYQSAYKSWLNDFNGGLVERHLAFDCEVPPGLQSLLEALEELHWYNIMRIEERLDEIDRLDIRN